MKKVLICGLGAIGLTVANQIKRFCELKILVDKERLIKYQNKKPILNNIEQNFTYILPEDNFTPDLIIISTKSYDLNSAIENIKNFISSKTIIISLLNGISSEETIKKAYTHITVLKSYFIGHSAVRINNEVTQDGIGEIVIENNDALISILNEIKLNYTIATNINYAMWLKFTLNLFSNQTSAILNLTFGEMKNNQRFIEFAKKIIKEVEAIAKQKNIQGLENLEADALNALSKMCDEGKTSMLQDVLANKKTEVDIFAGEIIKLGKELGVATPYNQVLYDLIKIKEYSL